MTLFLFFSIRKSFGDGAEKGLGEATGILFLLDLSPGRPAQRTPQRHHAHCVLVAGWRDLEHRQKRSALLKGEAWRWEGVLSENLYHRFFSVTERSVAGGEVGSPGANKEGGHPLPTEIWPGAQGALKSDFKVKKPDAEAVAMLQWVWKLERRDHAEGTRRA